MREYKGKSSRITGINRIVSKTSVRVIYSILIVVLTAVTLFYRSWPGHKQAVIILSIMWFPIIWVLGKKLNNKYGPTLVQLLGTYILGILAVSVKYFDMTKLKQETISSILLTLGAVLLGVTISQIVTYWGESDHLERKPVRLTISLVVYELAAGFLFYTSMKLCIVEKQPKSAAIYLLLCFIFNLVIWFCYFSNCGWILKTNHLSLNYEFWTLLIKSVIKSSLAYGAIVVQLITIAETKKLGSYYTIILGILTCCATSFYPMLDMYQYCRTCLEPEPIRASKI
ncbi:hypothetical protein [Lactobacillus sp. W8172]|uniref:hypothetical protein n=1 Tax=Lactobacillus sp. W8172 TaxID=2751025 RepID=UPI0018DE542C|nr:hypothetical protein [Lactobacillus sp. W8172]MBI0022636.1 hypothetical protein [Lactobacillus sp. W8172]